MHFQRFVAWENLPSLTSKSDDFESSSSGSVSEYESEGLDGSKITNTKKETMPIHSVEIPVPIKHVLDKIEVSQLERAKKDISKKLFRILENVNRAYERYKKDDGIDPKIEKEYNSILTWEEKNRRSQFLNEIDGVLNVNMGKLLELRLVLDSLKECSGMLEKVELQEKLIPSEKMIEKMEIDLLKFIEKIEENVRRLIKLFQPLFTEKMRARRKSGPKYALLFKAWRDKVADMPQEGEPLTPEQMLDDESLAFTRCHDVNNMIHELGESSFFNKAEIAALKYTTTMVGNLIKAFSLLVKQCRNLKLKCDSLTIVEGRKQDPQVVVLQRELRMALERKMALEKQVQSAEERCMALLVTNDLIQKELHDANEKASLADNITFPRVTSSKPQSKPKDVEKDVKSKQAEKPKLPTEPRRKVTRKGEGESLDEKWESQGESSQASLLTIYGREPTPTGSIQDTKIKQKKTVSDKGKTKQPPKATDEKGPSMERSLELLDQMLTSHKTLDTESDRVAPKSSDEKPTESSPSSMEPSSLTEPTAEDISGQSLQKDKKGARRRISMKGTAEKLVLTVKTKKIVKFPPTKDTPTQDMPSQDITPLSTTLQEISEGELTQKPMMTSETKKEPETLDKTLTQTAAAEQTEEAPKSLADKSKDTREKKETKRWSKLLQLPKQAEKSEGVRHGLNVKLQETARDIPTLASPTQEIPILDTPTQDTRTQDILTLDTPTQDTRTQDILTLDTPTQDTRTQDILTLDTPTQDTRTQDILTQGIHTQDTPTQDTLTQEITRGELTQRPTTTSETKEEPVSQDKDLTQTVAAEKTEEAPKQLADKSKDIREKKETKRWSKLLQIPKQAEKTEGVRHVLHAKLQETARDTPIPDIPTPDTPTQDIPGGELTQRQMTTSETKEEPESQDKNLTQTTIIEQAEEAPKQLAEKSKDIREKKEMKRWSKALQVHKKAEKSEGVRHGVDAKLQETARDIPTPSLPTPDTPIQDIPGGELTQKPTTSETKEEPESQDKDVIQTTIAKQIEESPKQLADKSKDIREKKEMKRWSKALQLPKQAEKLEGVRHGVDAKLQETARDIPTPSLPTPDTPTQDIPGGELSQKPTTSETKEEPESQDKDVIQTTIAKQIEEAPKQLADKSKDIREKKEMKRWSKALQLPKQAEKSEGVRHGVDAKQAEKSEGVRHGVDAKLQETARDIPTPSIPTPDTPTQDIPGGELTQKPTTSETKEEPESQDKDLIQTTIAEQIEEAPKQLADKSKDIREKKEMKRWSKALQLPKQAEKSEGVIHSLNIKLQEIAREKDGMIDIETIKHVFEELESSYKDTAAGPVTGGRHTEKPSKILSVKKSTVPPDTAEQAYTTKEKRKISRVEETALREFQEATLACLEDKLEKLKKGPPGSGKVSVQLQPTDLQAQQLFKAIQDKVEECFLIKQKSFIHLEEDKQILQSMEKLEDTSGEEITKIPSSTHVTPTQDIPTQDTTPQDFPTQVPPPPPLDIPPLVPLPQEIPSLVTPPKDISTMIPSPSPQDIPPLVPPPQEVLTLVTPLQDIPHLVPSPLSQDIPPVVPPPQEIPILFPPPQDISSLFAPPQEIPTLLPPPQDIPTLILPPPPQDIPTLVPPPQEIPPLVPPPQEMPTLFPPPQEIPPLFLPPLEIPPLVLPPLELPPLVLPPLEIPPQVLPPLEIPTMVPAPLEPLHLVMPTMVPPPLEKPNQVMPPLEISTLLPPPPPQDIVPLVPPPQEIPTLVSPPQDISTLVLLPPPQKLPPLVLPSQVIPTLVLPPPPQKIPTPVLPPPPPPQKIPPLVLPPQVIPPQVLPPPPQEIPPLVPPPQVIPTQVLPPPPQEIPPLVPPPQVIPTLVLPPPPQEIPPLVPPPQVIPTPVPPPPDIPILVPPPQEIPILVPPPQVIPTLVPSPQVIPTPVPPPPDIPILVPPPQDKKLFSPQDVLLPKWQEKEEDLAKALPLTKEKQSLEHVPDEDYQQVKERKQEGEEPYKKKIIIPISEEQPKTVDKGKELSPKEDHRKQQEIWQEEDKEHEIKRRQWQQQQAKHEGQMETLRQAHLQQEDQYKQRQKEQQQKQQELEHIWEKRWQQQLQSWQQERQKQQDQENREQEQKSKVLEKQRLVQKEHKPLSPKLKVVESSVLDIFISQCKMPPVSKEKIISTTPRITPSPSIALKEDSSELETTWFPKMLTKIEELPTYDIAEKRYWINVEAQRKNLKLLREASQKAGISPDLYNDTKETIKQALHSNVERLALLFRKYKSFYNLHEVRHSLILQLDTAKEAKDGAKMQNLYKMVDKVDAYQKKLLDSWKVKQNVVERQHQHCLRKMVDLFAQLHSSAQLHLSNPCLLIVKSEDSTEKETFHMPHIKPAFLKSRVYKSPLIRVKKSQDFTVTAMVRRKPSSEQIESLWKTDITELSFPLGPKAPVSFLWSETSGFPDIPRFLELDISSVRGKPLLYTESREILPPGIFMEFYGVCMSLAHPPILPGIA
ncbi:Proline-rich extensin-like protein EPR1, partial [Ophiophagus hannah]